MAMSDEREFTSEERNIIDEVDAALAAERYVDSWTIDNVFIGSYVRYDPITGNFRSVSAAEAGTRRLGDLSYGQVVDYRVCQENALLSVRVRMLNG